MVELDENGDDTAARFSGRIFCFSVIRLWRFLDWNAHSRKDSLAFLLSNGWVIEYGVLEAGL